MSEKSKSEIAEQLINENLKRVYSSVADEELPTRFKDLLAQLKQSGAGANTDDGAASGDTE